MGLWLLLTLALAQVPGAPPAVPSEPEPTQVTAPRLPAGDVVIWVRKDGNLLVDDRLVLDTDLPAALTALQVVNTDLGVVVRAHEEAPAERVVFALAAATDAGVERVALRIGGAYEGDPDAPAETIEGKPKRHKMPQNPYAHTDFTAYTLERGETRIGLAAVTYGLTRRVQLGTVPLLDVVGIPNLIGKANIIRQGRMDYAILGNVYHAPIAKILNRLDTGALLSLPGGKRSAPKFEAAMSWLEVGAKASVRISDPWSAHLGLSFARVNAQGEFSLGKLPNFEVPGFGEVRGDIKIAPQLVGELLQFKFASDLRFNRRDSLILQFSAPSYFAVRGLFHPPKGSVPADFKDLYLAVGYDQWIPLGTFYSASLSWHFSWKHIDLRLGLPIGPSPLGFFQAFDLSYRFGGKTRRAERELRRGYREDKKAVGEGTESG